MKSSPWPAVFVMAPLLAACTAAAPPGARPAEDVTADDRAVMEAVLDHLVRPRGLAGRGEPGGQPILVFDETVELCPGDPSAYPRRLPGCIGSWMLAHLDSISRDAGDSMHELFARRNNRTMPIGGTLGDDVTFIPSSAVSSVPALGDFVRRHGPNGQVVAFSAPVYPDDTSAVIFFHHAWNGGGFVQLERDGTGWSPSTSSTWQE